jgi:predicted phosphodiesterase
VLRAVPLLTLFFAVLFAGGAVSAEIVIGPVLEFPGTDRMTLFWETDAVTERGAVVVRSLNGKSEKAVFESSTRNSTFHKVAVSGLSSDTEYGYSVLGDDELLYKGRFRTLPERGDYRVAIIGDTHLKFKEFDVLAKQIDNVSPNFIVHLGDFVCVDYDKDEWKDFFQLGKGLLDHVPIFPVIGNHDCSDGKEVQLYDAFFVEPDKSLVQPRYYKALICDDLYIVLDVETKRPKIEQWRWFARTLIDAAGDENIGRIFVFSHEGVISFKGGRRGSGALKHFLGIMDYAGVSAIFSGHDHHFVTGRTYNGIDFFIAGGGGGPLADINEKNFFARFVGTMEKSYKGHHFLVMDVTDEGFTVRALNSEGEEFYRKETAEPR